jgi:hypothetical protein
MLATSLSLALIGAFQCVSVKRKDLAILYRVAPRVVAERSRGFETSLAAYEGETPFLNP